MVSGVLAGSGNGSSALADRVDLRRLEAAPLVFVFLTMHAKTDLFHAAMDLGARGYILKDSAILEVAQGLLAVAAGQHYVSASLTVQLLNRNRQVERFKQGDGGLHGLSEYERRILRMVAHHKSNKEIADELCVQYRTVETAAR
jgi:DNA-binding NarL/FixJ family response regulator